MKLRRVAIIIAFVSFASAVWAQQPRTHKREDIVAIIYEFTLSADGKAHDIRVSQALWQKDRKDAMSVLTDADKAHGAGMIAAAMANRRSSPPPNIVGKKRYDYVLFDAKAHEFSFGTRPQ